MQLAGSAGLQAPNLIKLKAPCAVYIVEIVKIIIKIQEIISKRLFIKTANLIFFWEIFPIKCIFIFEARSASHFLKVILLKTHSQLKAAQLWYLALKIPSIEKIIKAAIQTNL